MILQMNRINSFVLILCDSTVQESEIIEDKGNESTHIQKLCHTAQKENTICFGSDFNLESISAKSWIPHHRTF